MVHSKGDAHSKDSGAVSIEVGEAPMGLPGMTGVTLPIYHDILPLIILQTAAWATAFCLTTQLHRDKGPVFEV